VTANANAIQSRATRVLVVDDERMNREVLVANLRAAGYETVTAEDGQEAWETLARDPDGYDVVLLDRRMPRMDGMELLARLKNDPRLRSIPVIMQTAYASSEDVVEGVGAGVYYYLAKPLERRVLLTVVQSAAAEHERFRRLQDDLEKRTTALTLMESGTFRFRTPDEGNSLAVALARTCPRTRFVVVGLSELFTNAVEHGNLAITFEEKASMLAAKRLAAEVEKRLAAPEYRDRRVSVHVERRPDEVRFLIRDEGAGFDWRRYVDLDPARAFEAHGRGIAMARRLSFDSLEYRDPGNEVLCVVREEDKPSAARPDLAFNAAVTGEDLRSAQAMQVELLPTAHDIAAIDARYGVRVSGLFETSADLGGDIWGLDILDDHRFALYLADFSGHGVAAAMNTFRLHTLVRNLPEGRDRPGDYLAQLNRNLSELLPVGQYATMLYGVMDVAAATFTYAAAAAPHPLVVALDGSEATLGDGSGLPLGVSRATVYAERCLAVPPGSLLFLHSDALGETPLKVGKCLGSAGIVDMVKRGMAAGAGGGVDALLAPFLAAVRRPLRDDLTAVCCLTPPRG
jgi:phosphoserine phosphatase RsbU/P